MSGRMARNKGYNQVTFLKGNLWKRSGIQSCHASIVTKTDMKFQTLVVLDLLKRAESKAVNLAGFLASRKMMVVILKFICGRRIVNTQLKCIAWLQKHFWIKGQRAIKSIISMATSRTTGLTIWNGSPIKKTIGTLIGLLKADPQLNTKVSECHWLRPAPSMRWMAFDLKTHAEG